MTAPGQGGRSRRSPVNADVVENLDGLMRDLDDIEAVAAAALSGRPVNRATAQRLAGIPRSLPYDELTAAYGARRENEGWGDAKICQILDATAIQRLDEWRNAQRHPWTRTDLLVVGTSGFFGALANLYDTQVDSAVLEGLSWLKNCGLLHRWETDAARLPIDYTGPGFGGPAHRVRSAGHDIGRFFNALNQVRTGTFEGTWWDDGRRFRESVTTTRSRAPFAHAPEAHVALALLLKHWAADFVTPMSLPLPGWSLLYEMPDRDLRKFAHDAYAGSNTGDGLNLRSGTLSPGLGMVTTEVIIRTHIHLSVYRHTGSPRLAPAECAQRTEMLLAAHAAAGAVTLSKTVAAAITAGAPSAARHLNIPVLLRIGVLALQARTDAAARRCAGAPSWEQLLADDAATWTLPEAVDIAELIGRPTTAGTADTLDT